jgi:hypothetical protein
MTPWQEVRALAEKATSGVWAWWTSNSTKRISIQNGGDGRVLRAYVARDGLADISVSDEDAALIVAAVNLIRDPAFIGMMEDAARYRVLRNRTGDGWMSADAPQGESLDRLLDAEIWRINLAARASSAGEGSHAK